MNKRKPMEKYGFWGHTYWQWGWLDPSLLRDSQQCPQPLGNTCFLISHMHNISSPFFLSSAEKMQSLGTAENPQMRHHRSPSPGWGPATSSRSHKTCTLPFHSITAAEDDQQTWGRAGGHRREPWWTPYLALTLLGWWLSCRETNNLFCLTTIKRICPARYTKEFSVFI